MASKYNEEITIRISEVNLFKIRERGNRMIPIYIYCTKAKPYLQSGIVHGEGIKYPLSDRQSEYFSLQDLNGLVVARCECKEIVRLRHNPKYFPDDRKEELEARTGLDEEAIEAYGKGRDLFAYHLEQVEALEKPMQISDFYSDEACTKPLTRAPQSFQKVYYLPYDANIGWESKKVHGALMAYLFSDRSPFVCKILNGEKDLEIRKSLIKEANDK
jgi:hypothetical protein